MPKVGKKHFKYTKEDGVTYYNNSRRDGVLKYLKSLNENLIVIRLLLYF